MLFVGQEDQQRRGPHPIPSPKERGRVELILCFKFNRCIPSRTELSRLLESGLFFLPSEMITYLAGDVDTKMVIMPCIDWN